MAESGKVLVGSNPEVLRHPDGPLIFGAHAADMAKLVVASSPGSVLETEAGSGVVTMGT